MPAYCAVPGCDMRRRSFDERRTHRFPFKYPEIAKKWAAAIRPNSDWKPRKCSYVCSDHFSKESYRKTPSGPRLLHRFAVPSINLSIGQRKPKKRQVNSEKSKTIIQCPDQTNFIHTTALEPECIVFQTEQDHQADTRLHQIEVNPDTVNNSNVSFYVLNDSEEETFERFHNIDTNEGIISQEENQLSEEENQSSEEETIECIKCSTKKVNKKSQCNTTKRLFTEKLYYSRKRSRYLDNEIKSLVHLLQEKQRWQMST